MLQEICEKSIPVLPNALAHADAAFYRNGRVQQYVPQVLGKYGAGSLTGARETKQTPSAKSSLTSAATCKDRRVFPTPPVPMSVTRRTDGCRKRAPSAATSCSRPKNEVSGTGSVECPGWT